MNVTAYGQIASSLEKITPVLRGRYRFLYSDLLYINPATTLLESDASTSTNPIGSIDFCGCDHLLEFFVAFLFM
jgi:hypothetical protein